LGDDQISGFRRERVWLIFTRPVKNSIVSKNLAFYRIDLPFVRRPHWWYYNRLYTLRQIGLECYLSTERRSTSLLLQ